MKCVHYEITWIRITWYDEYLEDWLKFFIKSTFCWMGKNLEHLIQYTIIVEWGRELVHDTKDTFCLLYTSDAADE